MYRYRSPKNTPLCTTSLDIEGGFYSVTKQYSGMGNVEKALETLAGREAVGEKFFDLAVLTLADTLDCKWAAIGELSDDGNSIKVIAACEAGVLKESWSYGLPGTPCCKVYMQEKSEPHWFIPDGTAELFPDDLALAEKGVRSYRGELFLNEAGNKIGHIFVMDDRPAEDNLQTRSFFRMVAQRTGAEFRRVQTLKLLAESEIRYQAVVHDQTEMISRYTPDGMRTFVNRAYCKACGKDRDELLDASAYEGMTEEDLARLKKLKLTLTPENPTGEYEISYPDPAGGLIWQMWTKRAIYDDKGNVIEYQAVGRDVSENRQYQERLSLALIDAENANRGKSEFLATMSHELRTPLNAIVGFSEVMMSKLFGSFGSSKYEDYIGDIHNSSIHLLNLVNDILDLSVIEAGEHQLAMEQLQLSNIANDCLPLFLVETQKKNIEYICELPEALPMLVADKRALKQILLNILSNAVKFTPEGGKIFLSANAVNGKHIVKIKDTGRGIAPEMLPRLTDPFVSTEIHPHNTQEGTGLGLAIVDSLVKLHGGTLYIESVVGKGTTVTVALPSEAKPSQATIPDRQKTHV